MSHQHPAFLFCFGNTRVWTQGLTFARQKPYHLSQPASLPALFTDGFFGDKVTWTICLGLALNCDLLISASWVARITGIRCPAFHRVFITAKTSKSTYMNPSWDKGYNAAEEENTGTHGGHQPHLPGAPLGPSMHCDSTTDSQAGWKASPAQGSQGTHLLRIFYFCFFLPHQSQPKAGCMTR
jgi:hypothetical protein